jgi:hypothetical protein
VFLVCFSVSLEHRWLVTLEADDKDKVWMDLLTIGLELRIDSVNLYRGGGDVVYQSHVETCVAFGAAPYGRNLGVGVLLPNLKMSYIPHTSKNFSTDFATRTPCSSPKSLEWTLGELARGGAARVSLDL